MKRRGHHITTRDDFYRPLPVKSEAVVCTVNAPVFEAVVQVDEPDSDPDAPLLIDESERLLSAEALYAQALEGCPETTRPRVKQRIAAPNQTRLQLWGAGTSGIPRRGSRTIRLFHADPPAVFATLVVAPETKGLRFDPEAFSLVDAHGEIELHGRATLAGAFAVRSAIVDVSLRAARFNPVFTAVELRLSSRGHPRRFFRAAHDAIEALDLPGRT